VENGEKHGQLSASPVHRDRATFKIFLQFMQNPLRKNPTAFVKVVGGSEIYNFPIHHFVHFYSNFWSFSISNSELIWALRRGIAPARAPSAPARAPRPHRRPDPLAPS
jgi:hypothetical protein